MKKVLHMGMCILTMMLLTGCSSFKPQSDAVFVEKNGKIIRAFVDEFVDGSNQPYNVEDIRAMMQDELDAYSEKFGVAHVVLKECTLENGILTIQIACDEAKYYQDYCSYYNDDFTTEGPDVEFFAGAVADAAAAYDFEGEFVTSQGEAARREDVTAEGYYKAVVLNEPLEVYVPGKILYVSSNVELVGEKQARVPVPEGGQPQRAYIIYK